MKKYEINPENIADSTVWMYTIANVNDDSRKTVLSRRYFTNFEDTFDPAHVRHVLLDGAYGKIMKNRIL